MLFNGFHSLPFVLRHIVRTETGSNNTTNNAGNRNQQQACVTYFASFVSFVCCYIFQWLRTLSIGVFFFSELIKKINKNCIFADFVAS